MSTRSLTVHRFAQTLLDGLSARRRRSVLKAVEALRDREPVDWPEESVTRLAGEPPLYLLRVPPDLCVFLTTSGDELQVTDVVLEEAIRFFTEQQRNGTAE